MLRNALGACQNSFLGVVIFSASINVLMLVSPLYMMQVFDRVMTSRNLDTLLLLFLLAIFALTVLSGFELLRSSILVRVSCWLERRLGATLLRTELDERLKRRGAPSVQGLRDLQTLRGFLTGPAIFPVIDAPWMPLFVTMVFLLHPWLGMLTLAGGTIVLALAIINEWLTRDLLNQANQQSAEAFRLAEAILRNAEVVRSLGMTGRLISRWEEGNRQLLNVQGLASDRGGAVSAASKFLRAILQIAMQTLAAYLVVKGEVSPGALVAGSILMARALAPIDQAIASWRSLAAARTAYTSLQRQLGGADVEPPATPLPRPDGRLEVDRLVFAYQQAADPLLRSITFALAPGQSLGVLGPSGSGKSTLARLLTGTMAPASGHVRLDGMDVASWESDQLGPHIGYLPQDIDLFDGTVAENIARMDPDASPDRIFAAARLAGVHDAILRTENGYDTRVGFDGWKLSGGLRQRIGLARAVYGEPALIVLDEPNSNLDAAGEATLIEALASLKRTGVTTVVITHRRPIVEGADRLLILGDGGVRAFGPRADVLAQLDGPARPVSVPA